MEKNIEVEARFINIDYDNFKNLLIEAGAEDKGVNFLSETILFDKDLNWNTEQGRFVRVRKTGADIFMTFKHNKFNTADGTTEVELKVDNYRRSCDFLQEIGLVAYRQQEKKRHSFVLGEVNIDIDFWPSLPPYAEFEGPTVDSLKKVAERLGLDWKCADFHNAAWVIENIYSIPFKKLRSFTFDKIA